MKRVSLISLILLVVFLQNANAQSPAIIMSVDDGPYSSYRFKLRYTSDPALNQTYQTNYIETSTYIYESTARHEASASVYNGNTLLGSFNLTGGSITRSYSQIPTRVVIHSEMMTRTTATYTGQGGGSDTDTGERWSTGPDQEILIPNYNAYNQEFFAITASSTAANALIFLTVAKEPQLSAGLEVSLCGVSVPPLSSAYVGPMHSYNILDMGGRPADGNVSHDNNNGSATVNFTGLNLNPGTQYQLHINYGVASQPYGRVFTFTTPSAITMTKNTPNTAPACASEGGKIIIDGISGGSGGPYKIAVASAGGAAPAAGNYVSVGAYPFSIQQPSGDYDVWIMDNKNCARKVGPVQTIPEYTPITASLAPENIINPFCDGRANGSTTFAIGGGNGTNYEYALNGASTFTPITTSFGLWTISNLDAGSYTFVFRNPGCSADTKTIFQTLSYTASAPVVTVFETLDPLCYGETGQITFNVSGGASYGYEVSVDNGAYNSIALTNGKWLAENLPSGNNTFSFKIAGCIATTAIGETIAPVPSEIAASVESVIKFGTYQVSCNGGSDAQVVVSSLSGGTAPSGFGDYTVQLSKDGAYFTSTVNTVEEKVLFNGLAAGSYTVEIGGRNNCSKLIAVVVREPELVSIVSVLKKDEVCKEANDGEVTATFTGGTGSYTVRLWQNGNERTEIFEQEVILTEVSTVTLQGIPPGVYKLGIKDTNGCPDNWRVSGTITIEEPDAALGFAYDVMQAGTKLFVTCKDESNGSVHATANGGWGSYQYSRNDVDYVADGDFHVFDNLSAGDHTFFLKDALGCKKQYSVTIAEPAEALELSYEVVQPSCPEKDDGVINVSADRGWGEFEFSVDGSTYFPASSSNNFVFEGFQDGAYHAYVRDAKGCVVSLPLTITDRAELSVSVAGTNDITCFGRNTGSIALDVNGGTSPFDISAFNNTTSTSTETSANPLIDQLFAGSYTVMVMDALGCKKTVENVSILEPDQLVIAVDQIQQPSNCGDADARIATTISGGSSAYNTEWYNQSVLLSTSEDIVDIPAGSYTLRVIDKLDNTCTLDETINVSDLFSPVIELVNLREVTCDGGSDGAILISVSDAADPVQISWSNGRTGLANEGLTAGVYHAQVTDAKKCTGVREILVATRPILTVESITQTSPSCPSQSDGALAVNVINAQGAFKIDWSGDGFDGQTVLNSIPAGTYTVRIDDEAGCSIVESFVITDPLPVAINTVEQIALPCFNDCNGTIDVAGSGGSGEYDYEWTNSSWTAPRSSNLITDLCAGLYTVKIRDTKGCETSRNYTLLNPLEIDVDFITTMPVCFDDANGEIIASVRNGKGPYRYTWEYEGWSEPVNTADSFVEGLKAGTYQLRIDDSDGCSKISSVVLANPAKIEIDFDPEIYLCGGESIALNAGYPGSTYVWTSDKGFNSDKQVTTISEPAAYTVKVVSDKNCVGQTDFVIINSNELMKANFIISSEAVIGDTVVVIDITNPVPNQIEWDVTGNPEKLQEEDFYYQEFKYYQPGEYEVTLYAYKGQCMDAVTKSITLYPSKDAMDEGRGNLGFEGVTLDYFNLHPNPNDGTFHVTVEFNRESAVRLNVMPLNQQLNPQVFEDSGKTRFEFDIAVENKISGMYILYLESGDIREVIKFIVE